MNIILLSLLVIIYGGTNKAEWVDIEDNREDKSIYNIGVGIADTTGPSAGINMMGFAEFTQIDTGIHMRVFSRAFIFDDDIRRLVFVSIEAQSVDQLLKKMVITRLAELYGSTYTFQNVIISATHTHSAPGGFLQNFIFEITSLGIIKETLNAMVDGIVESIENAHNNMVEGTIRLYRGKLESASINRSPTAYANNPEAERLQYDDITDKTMTLLKLVDNSDGNGIGMINWFAVHANSMDKTNTLVSGDNKGYASQLFEAEMNIEGTLPGKGTFIAAFAQSNCGDVSPNTKGPLCTDTGLPCDDASTCGGNAALCLAEGPGNDIMESTKIIGELQYQKAMELYADDDYITLTGPIQYSEQLVDMPSLIVNLPTNEQVTLCKPALGYSFPGGTIDGSGFPGFKQGTTESNPFLDIIFKIFLPTSDEQTLCQAPKPILLNTGNYNFPYPWHPSIMDSQIGRIGNLFINAVPGEFTTMAGRRMNTEIHDLAESKGISNPISVIAGYSNSYSQYITTKEEYAIQRYEGSSTIFGPNTLEGYIQQYNFLLESMAEGIHPEETLEPEDLSDKLISLVPGVIYDTVKLGDEFGQVSTEPDAVALIGETVVAKFISGHPRNNLKRGETYLAVEKKVSDTDWEVIATDANWETRFEWKCTSFLLGKSLITVYWDIPASTEEGTYRITHYGSYKSIFFGEVKNYEGTTNEFTVQ